MPFCGCFFLSNIVTTKDTQKTEIAQRRWKYGLESAIVAHMFGHILLAIATYAGAYL
jgi:hypothetical protein